MTIVLESSYAQPAATSEEFTDVIVHISARVVSATRARRKVNGWLVQQVGDRLLAGEPELTVGERLLWRVPVRWTSPIKGELARIDLSIIVDAATGEVMADDSTAQEIQQHVAAVAHTLRAAA